MNAYESETHKSIELDDRTERALEEPLSVVTLEGTPVESRDETVVQVVSHSGESYHVDATVGRCECPDHKHRDAECKHIRRAQIELGETPIDSRVLAAVDVDSQLGTNAPGPRVATSDGGIIEPTDDGRPDDCDCGDWNDGLACWPCYREGFDEPASADK